MSEKDIFICYRHEDSSAYAGRLADELGRRFGKERIFRDAGSQRGLDFRDQINEAIDSCAVLIAMIGPRWLLVQDESGRRRLDHPDDLIVLEIAAALERDIRVIPVLVSGVRMPREADLPKRLAKLAYRTAVELSDAGWDYEISALVEELSRFLESRAGASSHAPAPAAQPLEAQVRQRHLDELDRCIARGIHVVIGGAPGIGKTWLLNALRKAYPQAVHVRLEEGKTEPMRELRLALHGHYGAGEFPLDNEAGIDALRRTVPVSTLLLVDNADERESVEAVLRLARFVDKVTVVVTSRRAQEFRDFRRLKLLRLPRPDAEAIVSEYELDDATQADVLKKGDGNPLMLRVLADAAKHGGDLDEEENPLRSMIERWPADEERALWIIGELPSLILAEDLLVEVGGLTHAGMALLRGNAVVASVNSAPVRRPPLLEIHPTLRFACQRRLPTVRRGEQEKLRVDAARYYICWLRGQPSIDAIDMARSNLMHLMQALDEHSVRAELALELIGDQLEDPAGYLPSRGLAGLLVEPELRSKLEETAAQVQGLAAAKILKNLGLFCHWANAPGAELLLLSAKELYDGLGDEVGSAETAWILGIVADETGHYSAAERLYRAALSALGDPSARAVSHHLLGCSLYRQERYVEARAELERAKEHARSPALRVRIDLRLAYVELAEGNAPLAIAKLMEVRDRAIALNRPRDAARSMRHIGQGQLRLGMLDAADDSLEQALKEFELLGDERGLGATLCALATTRRRQGRGDAWALAKLSRTIARGQPDEPTVPMRSPVGVARAEEELGAFAQAIGDGEAAIGHLRRACNIFEAIDHPRSNVLAAKLGDRRDAPIPLPRGILFDLVDTLAGTHPDAYEDVKRRISEALGVDHARFKAAWAKSRERASTDEHWTPADRIRWVAGELGAELSPRQTAQLAEHESLLWTSSVEIDPQTRGMIAELHERGLEMVLVTNGSSAMRDLPTRLGLTPLLRASLLSCEVGVLKPRPGIYRKALEKLGLPPQDCIYVGDGSDRELEGAKAVGLFAVRMLAHRRPPYSTRESLDWDATVHSLRELIERLVPRSSNQAGARCQRGPTDA